MDVEEWRAEAKRLNYLPGQAGVVAEYWRAWLRRDEIQRNTPYLKPCARVVRFMSPRERAELWEGRDLAKAQFLRIGRKSWYVIEGRQDEPAPISVLPSPPSISAPVSLSVDSVSGLRDELDALSSRVGVLEGVLSGNAVPSLLS